MSTTRELYDQKLAEATVAATVHMDSEKTLVGADDKIRDTEANRLKKLGGLRPASRAALDEDAAREDVLVGLAESTRKMDAFDAAVKDKRAAIQADGLALKALVDDLERPKRALKSFLVDPNFDPDTYKGDEGKALKLADSMIGGYRTRVAPSSYDVSNRGHPTGSAANAEKEDFGRVGHYWMLSLEAALHGYGARYALDEAVRLFDLVERNLSEMVIDVRGTKLKVWEFRFQRFGTRFGTPLSDDIWNDKEDALAFGALSTCGRIMFENLKTHPENKARVARCLEICRANEQKWLLKKGGNPMWRGALERVIHAFAVGCIYNDNMAAMETTPLARQIHVDLRDKKLPMLAAEMFYYDDGDGECITHAYNVLAVTEGKTSKPGSDAYIEDGYQFSVYTMFDVAPLLILGMRGFAPFNTLRFQRAYANGQYFGQLVDAPYHYTLRDGTKGVGLTDMDISPRKDDWLDQKNGVRPKSRRMKNDYGERILRKDREEDERKGSSYRPAIGNVEGFPVGLALMHGKDAMVEHSEAQLFGPLDKPRVGGHLIFTPIGRALREGLKRGAWDGFK